MASASEIADKTRRDDIRARWLLSTPALLVIFFAAVGPLLIVLVYSFLTPGDYGDVKWQLSTDAWTSVLFERDIFDDTLSFADANLSIFWRSAWLSLLTTVLTMTGTWASKGGRSRPAWSAPLCSAGMATFCR